MGKRLQMPRLRRGTLRRFQILYDSGAMPPSICHRELHSLIAVYVLDVVEK